LIKNISKYFEAFIYFRDQSLKRKVYWIDEKSQLEKFKVDELIIADGALSCGQ
jgi:uncharacterized protein (DUF1015 family)